MIRAWKLISGLFTGVIVGAIVVLLLTPKSGNEMQQEIQGGIEDLFENISNVIPEREFMVEKHLMQKASVS